MKKFNIHLVSDSTGETLFNIAKAVLAQFHGIKANERVWSLIRTKGQMEKVIESIEKNPGPVMYTIVEKEIRDMIKVCCRKLGVPCIPVLHRAIADLSDYLGMQSTPLPGRQHELDENYFSRVEAMNFAISHDDGQLSSNLNEADIILLGVSRTSKSPTCVYLAYRGYKAANIPFVLNCPLPENLASLTHPLIIGLTISTDRLMQIRKSRLQSINNMENEQYVDNDLVKEEITQAKKLFMKNNWPIIDVTRKSVEEVAATIIQYYQDIKINNHNFLNLLQTGKDD